MITISHRCRIEIDQSDDGSINDVIKDDDDDDDIDIDDISTIF